MSKKNLLGVTVFGMALAFAPVVMAQNIDDEGMIVPEEDQYTALSFSQTPQEIQEEQMEQGAPTEIDQYGAPTSSPTGQEQEMEQGTTGETGTGEDHYAAPAPSPNTEEQMEEWEYYVN